MTRCSAVQLSNDPVLMAACGVRTMKSGVVYMFIMAKCQILFVVPVWNKIVPLERLALPSSPRRPRFKPQPPVIQSTQFLFLRTKETPPGPGAGFGGTRPPRIVRTLVFVLYYPRRLFNYWCQSGTNRSNWGLLGFVGSDLISRASSRLLSFDKRG